DSKGCDDMVEMVAVVEPAEYQELEQQSERERGKERKEGGGDKTLRQRVKRDGKIGAQHVLNAVGEIDEIHHAENERETRRNQKQQNSELEAVESLDDEESRIHPLPVVSRAFLFMVALSQEMTRHVDAAIDRRHHQGRYRY